MKQIGSGVGVLRLHTPAVVFRVTWYYVCPRVSVFLSLF